MTVNLDNLNFKKKICQAVPKLFAYLFEETKMFTKPLIRAPKNILIKSFFLAIGYSSRYDLSHTFLKRLELI